MPLVGSCHRLDTNPRSSRRRSAGYRVPSFKSKNPFDRSRSSWRIWNPYFSSFDKSARRHSWIEPFFSSAVHSGETSVIQSASYPTLSISAFGRRRRPCSRGGRHWPRFLGKTRSLLGAGRKGGGEALR